MKVLSKFISGIAACLAIVGCSGVGLLNASVPHSGYSLHKDIAYDEGDRRMLDIYVPDDLKSPAPVIVFFYGGSWKMGSKDDYRFAGQAFASKGYITVVADYRLYPKNYFPAFMHDGASTFAWVHEHIGEYNGDAKNIFLAGHSAGAHIAMLLTLDNQYLKAAHAKREWIKGTIGIAGPYDFLPFTDPAVIGVFSKVDEKTTQPINYVSKNQPPILLLTGDKDEDVLPRNSKNLAAKLEEYNDPVELKIYPDVAHIGIVLSLAHGFRYKAPLLDDIDAFIATHRD